MKLQRLKGSVIAGILIAASWSAQATVVLDLTALNSSGTIHDALYTQVAPLPTGSGVIDPFVRISSANLTTVQGYNTTVNGMYQNDSTNIYNREVTVGQIGLIDTNGAADGGEVMRFLLDINQNGDEPLLHLDEVQIFLSKTANQSIEPVLTQGQLVPFALSTLVYQMDDYTDVGVDNSVTLQYRLNPGSGGGDMTLDIPLEMLNEAFALGGYDTLSEKNGAFIYLYSRFSGNNDGYEEWAAFKGNPIVKPPCTNPFGCDPFEVPEPNSVAIMSLGMFAAAVVLRRRRSHRPS